MLLTIQIFNELVWADGTQGLKACRWISVVGAWVAGIVLAITIGLSDITASIMEFVFVFFVLLYLLTFLHPMDSPLGKA